MSISGENGVHILVFPFPTAGHIIPLLDLTNLLLTRGLTVTIIVTPTHLPLLHPLLSLHSSSLHPFLLEIPQPPTFIARMRALGELSDPILHWFQSHPSPPVAIISDFFLGWTNQLASNLGVPRILFSPSGAMALSVFICVWRDLPKPANDEFPISFPDIPNSPVYPRWQVTRFSSQFIGGDPDWEFFRNGIVDNLSSWGFVFNSFTGLEGVYLDYVEEMAGHDRVWAVGPLLPSNENEGPIGPSTRGGSSVVPPHEVMTWLDGKDDGSVVYVCFGSRATLNSDQMNALTGALECSGVHFILCVKAVDVDGGQVPDGFDDCVIGRGFIIRGWAPQVAILRHRAVGVFLTHCGWNSVLEAIAAGVMMLTWPMDADQFSNAKLLIEQLGIAVQACEGSKNTVPDSAKLSVLLSESVSESRPERVRVREMREASLKAVVNGGSSDKELDMLVKQLGEL